MLSVYTIRLNVMFEISLNEMNFLSLKRKYLAFDQLISD